MSSFSKFACPNCGTQLTVEPSATAAARNGNSGSNGNDGNDGNQPGSSATSIRFKEGNFQAMSKKARELGGSYNGGSRVWTMPSPAKLDELVKILSKYQDNKFEVLTG